MTRVPLDIPPGCRRRPTADATGRAWHDMSLVRFVGQEIQPIGGWQSITGFALDDAVRSIISWRDNSGLRWQAAASLGQIGLWNGSFTDITPLDFQPGSEGSFAAGYGVGLYGMGTYGTPRVISTDRQRARMVDTTRLDNWGQDLLAMGSADGRLLHWPYTISPSAPMAAVAGAPSGRSFVVTEQRHVMVMGAGGDPRRIEWNSQEELTTWTPTVTNTAGGLNLRSTGEIISSWRVPDGVLVLCSDDVHVARYVGPPFVYGADKLGDGCGPVGPNAIAVGANRAAWIGHSTFWLYDGALRPLPVSVQAYVYERMNRSSASKCFAFHNGTFPEFWFFYPSEGSIEPDSYVVWDYSQNLVFIGAMQRTAGIGSGAENKPLMGDASGQVFDHEFGYLADGVARGADVFAETGTLQLANGERAQVLRQIYPDVNGEGTVRYALTGQTEPNGPMDDLGTYALTRADGVVDADVVEARSLRLRIEEAAPGLWQVGRPALELGPGARR